MPKTLFATCWLALALLVPGHGIAAGAPAHDQEKTAMTNDTLRHGISGSMGTRPGQRDAVVAIQGALLRALAVLFGRSDVAEDRHRRVVRHCNHHRQNPPASA